MENNFMKQISEGVSKPRKPRIVLHFFVDHSFAFYTDFEAEGYSIDERAPRDRVYALGPAMKRITPEELDVIIGDDAVHRLGDEPIKEQAIRARISAGPDGKPMLSVAKEDGD